MTQALRTKRLARPFEVRGVGDAGTFSGYGSVFGVRDSYGDVVEPGAFKASLAAWAKRGRLPAMLWQHDTRQPIGVWTSMREDAHGLAVEGRILVEAGDLERRAHAHLKAGSISGLSIGYMPRVEEFDKAANVNRVKQVDLYETSLVTFPANPDAQVDAVKAAIEAGPSKFERLLRQLPLSRHEAKALMAGGFVALRALRDADDEDEEAKQQALDRAVKALRALRGQETTNGRTHDRDAGPRVGSHQG